MTQNHTEIYDNDEIYIHAIESEKNSNELWVNIEWKERLAMSQFCLKSKIQTGKITDQFIDMLMKAASNSTFSVPDLSPGDLIQSCHLREGGLKALSFGDCTKNILLSKELGLNDKL